MWRLCWTTTAHRTYQSGLNMVYTLHCSDVISATWRLKSPPTLLFNCLFSPTSKETPGHLIVLGEGAVDSPHKGPAMWKAFPCHDVIISCHVFLYFSISMVWSIHWNGNVNLRTFASTDPQGVVKITTSDAARKKKCVNWMKTFSHFRFNVRTFVMGFTEASRSATRWFLLYWLVHFLIHSFTDQLWGEFTGHRWIPLTKGQ